MATPVDLENRGDSGVQGTPEGQQPAGTDVFQMLLAAQRFYTHLPRDMLQTRTSNVFCCLSVLELSSDNHLVDGPTDRPTD
ncbi:hypothetical protein DPMN_168606 [Dreissena polymorpha]|uniref:Uncharacterized protein n=1 Tax=Dreissena polymorpha TaxID=45954 RepID=A0A9D4F245_DREPO|nr:hypothetical protein DPMN_168606 [Dreissena polymorpha]